MKEKREETPSFDFPEEESMREKELKKIGFFENFLHFCLKSHAELELTVTDGETLCLFI